VLAAAIVAYGAVVRLAGAGRGLPYLHEWDEWFQLPPVIRMLLDHTLNPGIFIYGSVYYYLLLPVVYAHYLYLHALGLMKSLDDIVLMHPLIPGYGWYVNMPSFYLWARAYTALFGAATVYLTYRLGRAAFGRGAGLLAAALLAVAPGAVYYADTVRVDVPMAFFATAALLAGLGVMRRGGRRDYLLAGLLTGVAVSTKETAVWLVAPLAIAHLSNPRRAALIDARLGLMAAAIIAAGLAGTPYLLIRPDLVRAGLAAQEGTYGILALPNPVDFLYRLGQNLAYLAWPTQGGDWYVVPHAGLGLVPVLAAATGIRAGWRERPRVQAYLLAFPAVLLFFLARANVFYTRNLSAVLPIAAIEAAVGARWIWRQYGPAAPVRAPSRRAVLAAAAMVVLLAGPVGESARLAWWLNRHRDTRTQAVEWLRAHVPRSAKVAFELELAWFLPDIDGLPFKTEWTDRTTPLSWYAKERVDYAVVSPRNPAAGRPAVMRFPRPWYLPTPKEESKFVPNSYPIIDPAILVVRTRAR
jgi:hypothetical protein